MDEMYIHWFLILALGVCIGVYFGIEIERERMRADYVYILRMRACEQEEKECHKPTG